MNVHAAGAQPSASGPEEYFTGTVRIDPLFAATEPSRVSAAVVTFEPCARSAWHTHPLGQRLIVTAGCGRVQRWGGPIEVIRPGDVVIITAGRKTLARCRSVDGNGAYCDSGDGRRKKRRLA